MVRPHELEALSAPPIHFSKVDYRDAVGTMIDYVTDLLSQSDFLYRVKIANEN